MSLNLAEKQAVVAEVAKVAASAHSAIAAEYRGLSVAQLTALRVKARETGVYLRVVKNTLARRAVQGTEFECLQPNLVGPLILAFSQEEPGAAARIFKEFLKEKANDKLVIKTLAVGGQAFPASGWIAWPACRPATRRSVCSWPACGRRSTSSRGLSMKFPASWCARSKPSGSRRKPPDRFGKTT